MVNANLDYAQIKAAAEAYKADMSAFLRAMISHPSESCEEGAVCECIKAEMEKLGYDICHEVQETACSQYPLRRHTPTCR